MTIFEFVAGGGGGSGAFTTQMSFQTLNQGGGEYALPPGHIAVPAARNAANNIFPLLVARPCTLVQVAIVVATAATGAISVATRLNGGLVGITRVTLAALATEARGIGIGPASLVVGDRLEFSLNILDNEAAVSGQVTAWFV